MTRAVFARELQILTTQAGWSLDEAIEFLSSAAKPQEVQRHAIDFQHITLKLTPGGATGPRVFSPAAKGK